MDKRKEELTREFGKKIDNLEENTPITLNEMIEDTYSESDIEIIKSIWDQLIKDGSIKKINEVYYFDKIALLNNYIKVLG